MKNLNDLKGWQDNPRTIDDKAIKGLSNSINDFGDISGITFNTQTGRLVTGHQRINILRGLSGIEVNVEVTKTFQEPTKQGTVAIGYITVDGEPFALRVVSWDEKKEALANIGANNAWIQGEFINEKLSEIFNDYRMEELETYRLDKLVPLNMEEVEVLEDDHVLDKEKKSKYDIQEGDVYQLGNHYLICGDSTKAETYKKLLGNKKVDMIFTDPPYNVNYTPSAGSGYSKEKYAHSGAIFNDNKDAESFFEFITDLSVQLYDFSKKSAVLFMWYAHKNHGLFRGGAEQAAWKYMQNIIWIKERFVLSFGNLFHIAYEPCLVFIKDHKDYKYNKKYTNVEDVWNRPETLETEDFDAWKVQRDMTDEYVHPTQKPIRLAVNALKRCTEKGDSVLDAFGGSGSTMMACEQMDRVCYTIELDPYYCSQIIERWENFTKKEHKKING